ncbi:BRMS1-like transcriptional repressor [Vairimorpha necatrix]|uniref:BRMS1-like transcriptional repressor n=1 Tax=Vairimorpha necatrix TaxID=6039 RepID=A0AAX4JA65_9MICR
MVVYDSKDTITYSDILNEDIEKKLNRVKVLKKYTIYINNSETHFDNNSSSFTGGYNSYYEEYLKKRKSNNLNFSNSIKLEDHEKVQDLNEIYDDGGLMVRILDSSLYVNSEKFIKHDKVIIKIDKEEYNGIIACVDTADIVIKTKDGKRNRVNIETIKKGNFKIIKQ